jgi:hypothetical protein
MIHGQQNIKFYKLIGANWNLSLRQKHVEMMFLEDRRHELRMEEIYPDVIIA